MSEKVLRVWVSLFPKINIIIHPMIYCIFLGFLFFFQIPHSFQFKAVRGDMSKMYTSLSVGVAILFNGLPG